MEYKVERFSGNRRGHWRLILTTDDGARARQRYEAISSELRQGGVRLLIDGIVANSTWAPNLRTRW